MLSNLNSCIDEGSLFNFEFEVFLFTFFRNLGHSYKRSVDLVIVLLTKTNYSEIRERSLSKWCWFIGPGNGIVHINGNY